jgi:phosphoglycerate kinase
MFNKKTIRDIDIREKKVLVREDLNVPVKNGKVLDDTRITAALPTITYLSEHKAKVIIASHMGRPGGKIDKNLSLRPVAEYLDDLLPAHVKFAEDCIGPVAEEAVQELEPGDVLVLENTRFHPGEKANDTKMSKSLASLADIFVNDAFGTAHRAHASNVGVTQYIPAVAGFLMEKEIKYLGSAIENPDRPFIAILGGAKVSDKIGVINNLINKVDGILIGGGMANTFFAAQGYQMGDSLLEIEVLDIAKQLIEKGGDKLILPVDVVIGDQFDNLANKRTIEVGDIPEGWRILDIGPKTLVRFGRTIKNAKTIVWNGPMGVFEFPNFSKGTNQLARLVAESEGVSIIGGGDSASAIKQTGLDDSITHISTGGGASLEMLEGSNLPGLDSLLDK